MRTTSRRLLLLLVLVLIMVGCTNVTYDDSSNVVEAEEIASLMQQENVVLVDVRAAEEYAKGHVEGAMNLTTGELTKNEPTPGLIADLETVEAVLGSKGIGNDSKILLYDDSGIHATRLWWVLKVYGHEDVQVINGGAAALVKAGLPLSMEVPSYSSVDYTAKSADMDLIATYDMVNAQVENPKDNVVILDVRSAAEFAEGAIPGAILYPHTNHFYADGTFKSKRAIELDYKDLGIDKEDTVYVYCKTSVRATPVMLLLREAGFNDVKVYDGAWLEWEQQGTIELVEEPVVTPQDAS